MKPVYVTTLSLLAIIFGLLLRGPLAFPATCRIIYVDQNHPASADDVGRDGTDPSMPFRSIQFAVNRADPCDEVWVYPGVYAETVESKNPNVKLIAKRSPGVHDVIIAPTTGGAGVHVDSDFFTLEGFVIEGAPGDAGIRFQSVDGGVARDNIVRSATHQGILVNQSSNVLLESNIVHHNAFEGIKVRRDGGGTQVINNLVYSNDEWGIFIESEPGGTGGYVVEFNTVDANGFNSVASKRGGGINVVKTDFNTPGIVRHNIVTGNATFGVKVQEAGFNVGYNCYFDNKTDLDTDDAVASAGGDVFADPLYVNPGAENGYQISHVDLQGVSSPCLDAGEVLADEAVVNGSTATDSRPDGGVADLGYHTVLATSPTAAAPVAECLDLTVSASSGLCTASASVDAGSFDPDGGPVTLDQSPPPPYALEDNLVTLTVTDDEGQSDSCDAQVTVVDREPPGITCPAPQVVECSGPDGASVSVDATGIDNCGATWIACDPSPPFPLGTTTGDCTATDASGNQSACGFSVTVQDSIPPEIQCNAPATIVPPDAPVSFTATSTDTCGATLTEITGFHCSAVKHRHDDDDGDDDDKHRIVDKRESCVVEIAGDTVTIVDSGGVGDHITWTVTATDQSGNTTQKTCELDVVHPGKAGGGGKKPFYLKKWRGDDDGDDGDDKWKVADHGAGDHLVGSPGTRHGGGLRFIRAPVLTGGTEDSAGEGMTIDPDTVKNAGQMPARATVTGVLGVSPSYRTAG